VENLKNDKKRKSKVVACPKAEYISPTSKSRAEKATGLIGVAKKKPQ